MNRYCIALGHGNMEKIFNVLQAVSDGIIVDKKGFCRASYRAVMVVVAEKCFKIFRAIFLVVALQNQDGSIHNLL